MNFDLLVHSRRVVRNGNSQHTQRRRITQRMVSSNPVNDMPQYVPEKYAECMLKPRTLNSGNVIGKGDDHA
ncbi:hypothetical protein F7D08_0156 [Bifidobacterium cebidarum]|uniref:Uncharacterized protein n=1 Tax=Bifidobacterium cebidarum TaxID=2650773 RepID=A0A6I1GC57_9BIFI|nr:hypothetical protein F7D08_0156 [Bifidobacterium cebidarum]